MTCFDYLIQFHIILLFSFRVFADQHDKNYNNDVSKSSVENEVKIDILTTNNNAMKMENNSEKRTNYLDKIKEV